MQNRLAMRLHGAGRDWVRQPGKACSGETGKRRCLPHVRFSILYIGFPNFLNKIFFDLLRLIRMSLAGSLSLCIPSVSMPPREHGCGHVHVHAYVLLA